MPITRQKSTTSKLQLWITLYSTIFVYLVITDHPSKIEVMTSREADGMMGECIAFFVIGGVNYKCRLHSRVFII